MKKAFIILKNMSVKPYLAALLLASLSIAPVGAGEKTRDGVTLMPGHGMSFTIGSKQATTYFHPRTGECEVTVMISEADTNPNKFYVTASRLRMKLSPGKVTKLDDFQGKTLSLQCDAEAKTMTVVKKPLKLS